MGQGVLQDVSGRLVETFAQEPRGDAVRGGAGGARGCGRRRARRLGGDARRLRPAAAGRRLRPARDGAARPAAAAAAPADGARRARAGAAPPRRSTSARSAAQIIAERLQDPRRAGWAARARRARGLPARPSLGGRLTSSAGSAARANAQFAHDAPRPARRTAPATKPLRGPATSASQPTSGAPIGVEPRKTTRRAPSPDRAAPGRRRAGARSSRPRRRSRSTAPSGTSAATCSSYDGATATSSSATPKPARRATSIRGPTRPRAPVASAPSTEPMPIAAVSVA